MALQVWLPLTQDNKNQGIASGTINWTTAPSFTNSGKLGKALTTGGCTMPASMTSKILNNQEVTIACWLYVNANADDSTNRAMVFGNDTMSSLGGRQFSIFRYPNSDDIHLSWQSEANGSVVVGGVWSGVLTPHAWNHICITYKNPNVKIYVNGIQVGSTSGNVNASSFAYDTTIIHNSSSHYINDFRIYNNCLTPEEVKEVAQGLVLHYPLTNNGFGNPNILTDFDTSFRSYADGTFTLFSNQMNGGTQEIVSDIAGASKCLHLHSAGGNSRQYRTKSATSGKTYTISADYYSTSAQNPAWRGELNGGNYSWLGAGAAYTTPGKWQRLSYTYNNLTSDATIYFFIYCANGSDCYVKNIKIEESDTATAYCLGSATIPTIEYDCSGFNNNGIRTGTLTWSGDTSKYSASTFFASGNNYIDCGASQEVLPTDGLTVSLWTNYSTWGNPISCTEGGGWNFENSSGIQFPVYVAGVGYKVANSGVTTSTLQNEWHMLTGTFDKTNVKIYIDGVLKATAATGSTNGVGYAANHCYIGAEAAGSTSIASASYIGKINDVRIYATALSADDVKSLYQNEAYIDSSGNIYGQIHN